MKLLKLKYLLLLLFLFIGQLGTCCINEYRTLLNGKVVDSDASDAAPNGRINQYNKKYLLDDLKKADELYKSTQKIEDLSDYGALLVYNGQYEKAKALFINIENKKPGLYATASNLGTTYELLGQNDSAYYWIKKALKINPNSHEGSEWIHLKILEAKINSKGDEKYFLTHSVLSLDFGDSKKPENIKKYDLEQLKSQLYHQLNERISFIKPKDQIVGQLLFDLGNVDAITIDVKSGLQVYEVAKKYGFNSDLLEKRESHFKFLQLKADLRNNSISFAKEHPLIFLMILLASFIGVIFIIKYFYKRFKKRKSL